MTSECQTSTKISGYLEKKGKLRIGSQWKKYWFVLEGRLLLYYRSKDEYDAIRPCKGSVSLCPPCNVKPAQTTNCAFQIECRSSVVTLRAESRTEQERWMQAIMVSTQQAKTTSSRMSHFRYSLDELPTLFKQNKDCFVPLTRQNTMPHRFKSSKRGRKQKDDQNGFDSHPAGSSGSLNSSPKEKYPKSPRLPKNKNLSRLLEHSNSLHNVLDQVKSENDNLQMSQSCEEILESDRIKVVLDRREKRMTSSNKAWRSEDHVYISKNKTSCTSLTHDPIKEENETVVNLLMQNDQSNDECENSSMLLNEPPTRRNNSLELAYNSKGDNSNLYEDLDKFPRQEVGHNSLEDSSSQSSSTEGRSKSRGMKLKQFLKLVKSDKKLEDAPPKKISRNNSFMKRMWRRRSKSFENEVEQDVFQATQDKEEKNKKFLHNISDSQMLMQLQKIMESRRNSIKKTVTEGESKTDSTVQEHLPPEVILGKELSEKPNDERPSLPPRQSVPRPPSPYHDTPRSNKFIPKSVPIQEDSDPYRTIDEILDELDKEDRRADEKDGSIVEKFNDQNDLEAVVLRKKSKTTEEVGQGQLFAENSNDGNTDTHHRRHSDELSRLLEELGKVTSAPVLTPGTTCSLITPVTVSEEWLKVLPPRQRRMSDPDYDIPRPHSSLQLKNRKKEETEEPIPATRFFGPVLQTTVTDSNDNNSSTTGPPSWNSSMDPDSLEPEQPTKDQKPKTLPLKEEWEHNVSYNSHEYGSQGYTCKTDDKCTYSYNYDYSKCKLQEETFRENVVSRNSNDVSVRVNQEKREIIYKFREETQHIDVESIKDSLAKGQENFIDSLEPFAEISTAL